MFKISFKTFVILASVGGGLYLNLSAELRASENDYVTALSGSENRMIESDFYKKLSNSHWLRKNKDRKVNVVMGRPPCPTRNSSYYGNTDKYIIKWQDLIQKDMKGFPQKTIDYCTKTAFVIREGQVTAHPIAKKRLWRTTGSMYVKNKSSGDQVMLHIIQENDFQSNMSGGKVFNENLEQICDFKFISKTEAVADCIGLGIVPAKIENLSVFDGKFRVFGESDTAFVLISNLSVQELISKYPNLQKTPGSKTKCSFNCK